MSAKGEIVEMAPWLSVGLFLLVIACIPVVLKFVQRRYGIGVVMQSEGLPRMVSALSLGPGQRIVTVDVGPEDARERLTLGVTAQSISCLHRVEIPRATPSRSA